MTHHFCRRAGDVFLVSTDDGLRTPKTAPPGAEAVRRRIVGDHEVVLWDVSTAPGVDGEWLPPTAIRGRVTPSGLWSRYRAVAPTVETITADETHGAAWLSVRALEVVRDAAAVTDDWATVAGVARRLREARPGMAVVANRVNRVLATAAQTPAAVHDRAVTAITGAVTADADAAAQAASRLQPPVLTLSRSGTVAATLARTAGRVYVAESRPGGEGRAVATELATSRSVTVLPDAAVATLLASGRIGSLLVGADTVTTEEVVNKVGTRAAALAAAHEDVPVWVVAARDKIAPAGTTAATDEPTGFDPPAGTDGFAPTFDTTPLAAVTVVTETGLSDAAAVEAVAREQAGLADWTDGDTGSL